MYKIAIENEENPILLICWSKVNSAVISKLTEAVNKKIKNKKKNMQITK